MAEASLKLGVSWATKEGSLLGFNDQNGNYKPIPFDFTRATTATRVNRNGLIEEVQSGVPRIDFTGDGLLLLEPQRTNKMPYSEYFQDASFGSASITFEGGYLAPDGTNSAYKITATNPSSAYLVYAGISLADDARTIYARSVSGTGTAQLLSHNTNTNNIFNLTEEWQRFELNSTPLIANNFYPVDFRGSGTLTEIIIWGAQVEAGSYATSYIKTSGSAVTRNADVCNNAQTTFNDSEGVLYAEVAHFANDSRICLNDGSTSNQIRIEYDESLNRIECVLYNGSNQAIIAHTLSEVGLFNKLAFKYKLNDFALWINGVEVGTDTSGTTFSAGTLSEIDFDAGNGTSPFYGNCKELRVYNTALTDTELQELTTL